MPRTKLLAVMAALAVGTVVPADAANANDRDITCRGKLVDTAEDSFRVGKCDFVRESYDVVLSKCSRYTKNGHFLRNRYCVVKARVDANNKVTRAYSVQAGK